MRRTCTITDLLPVAGRGVRSAAAATAGAVLAFVLAGAPASSAQAQSVSGTIVDEVSGRPIAGALVSVITGRSDTATLRLSTQDGSFRIAVPPRRRATLLVRAIGLRPVTVELGQLAVATDTVINVRMQPLALTLSTVRVAEISECSRSQTGTSDIVDVWREVTKALENARLVRDSERAFDYVLYETLVDGAAGTVRSHRSDTSSWRSRRPFLVAPPRELASRGYIIEQTPTATRRASGLYYRGPDETVLLDRSFQSAHCFWASHGEGANAGLIGIHFVPISNIRINDIRGAFWVDSSTYELKRLEFLYTQIVTGQRTRTDSVSAALGEAPAASGLAQALPPTLSNPEPGGILEFERLPDGIFIVSKWRIFVNDTWQRYGTIGGRLARPRLQKETGGLVLRVGPGGG